MSCPSKDDFERTLEIADFAAQRLENRRQYEFKIFISYVTLLVLAIYKHDLLKPSPGECIGLVCGLGVIHIFYILWTISLSVANRNDSDRRNFYLKKAQDISDFLLKSVGDPLCRKMESDYDSEKPKKIKIVPDVLRAFMHGDQLWINYAATFQFVLPTIILFLLVHILSKNLCTELHRVFVMFIPFLPFFLIAIPTCCRKCCRKKGAKRNEGDKTA